ncbi:MAG: hypothetical protein JW704_02085 [Anaerolineaceae bacterium]|nr:hypothetical protein [Anaerolineaceae bacterium]
MTTKRCPICDKEIPMDADRCSNCGYAQDMTHNDQSTSMQDGLTASDQENKAAPSILNGVMGEQGASSPTIPLRREKRSRLKTLMSADSDEYDLDALRHEGLLPDEDDHPPKPERIPDETAHISEKKDTQGEDLESSVPEWLRSAEFTQAVDSSIADLGIPQTEMEASKGELPEWVRELQVKPGEQEEAPRATDTDEAVPELQIPPSITSDIMQQQRPINSSALIRESDDGIIDAVSSYVSGLNTPRKKLNVDKRRLIRNLWGVIGLAIFSLVAALLWSGSSVSLTSQPPKPEMAALNDFIEKMSPESVALIGVDYDLPLAGEIENTAMPVLVHLMTKQVNLVMISTRPYGPAMSNHLIQQGILWKPDYPTEKAYVFSYLPGYATGLLHFALSPQEAVPFGANGMALWHAPVLGGIQGVADFNMVVLLTDSSETGRDWLEQIQPRLGNTPFFVIASSQAGPILSPYLESGQIQAMVTGIASGASYERIQLLTTNNQLMLKAHQGVMLFMVVLFACVLLISVIPQKLLSGLEKGDQKNVRR